MATNFPTNLDTFVDPTSSSNLSDATVLHSTQHANLNDSVSALEVKVGINSSQVSSTLDYRITNHTPNPAGKLVTLGDSILAFGTIGSGSSGVWSYSTFQRGYIHWFNYLLGSPFEYQTMYLGTATPYFGHNVGIAGDWSYQNIARFDRDMRRQNPNVALLHIGDNDIANGQDQTTTFSNIKTLIDKSLSIQTVNQVVVISIFPRNNIAGNGYTSSEEVTREAVNLQVSSYCSLFPGRVFFINADPILCAPSSNQFNINYCNSSDGIHPNPWGSCVFAQQGLIPWYESIYGTSSIPRILPDAYTSSVPIPYGNIVINPTFSGSSGTVGAGFTGTVASSWTWSRNIGSSVSGVASIIQQTDWNGNSSVNFSQAVFTANGSGVVHELLNLVIFNNKTGVITGNYYKGYVEVYVTHSSGTYPIEAAFLELTETTFNSTVTAFGSQAITADVWPQIPVHIVLETPPIRADGSSGFTFSLYTRVNGSVSGTAIVQWGEPVLVNVLNPNYQFVSYEPLVSNASSTYTMTAATGILAQSISSGSSIVTLDIHGAYPGQKFTIYDQSGTASSNSTKIYLSNGNINGVSSGFTLSSANQRAQIIWDGLNANAQ